jgi:hypothetical protein
MIEELIHSIYYSLIHCYNTNTNTNTNLTQYDLTNTTTKLVVGEVAMGFFIIRGVPIIGVASSDQKLLFGAGWDVHFLLRIDLLLRL